MKQEWFKGWFDSPYYHILYKNHDEQDAQRALDTLLNTLDLPPGARILDLGCGKGRHARHLAARGYDTTGIDISSASITFARQFETDYLHFYLHDMRKPFRHNYFDAMLNMFTSFGYFRSDEDHRKTIENAARGLKAEGLFLLDFFNSRHVVKHLIRRETKAVNGINFNITRMIRNGYVYKNIKFEDNGKAWHFRECVRLFDLTDFERFFAGAGLQVVATYGDYDLQAFDAGHSKRLILVGKKEIRHD